MAQSNVVVADRISGEKQIISLTALKETIETLLEK